MKFRDYITEKIKHPKQQCFECNKWKTREEMARVGVCKKCHPKWLKKSRKREYQKMISPFS